MGTSVNFMAQGNMMSWDIFADPIFHNVRIEYNMGGNAVGFQNILNKAANPPSTYHAFDSNCVFYVYQAARAGGLDVPAPLSMVSVVGVVPYPGVLFETAYTPAALGSALRENMNNGDNRVSASNIYEVAQKSKGPC